MQEIVEAETARLLENSRKSGYNWRISIQFSLPNRIKLEQVEKFSSHKRSSKGDSFYLL